MGLFSSTPTHSSPVPSSDGAYEAPDRTARSQCWEARDSFFACLDRAGIIDSIKESDRAQATCGEEAKALSRDCASSWVGHYLSLCVKSMGNGMWHEERQSEID